VKIYRKLEAGISPEIEMGRFLTEVAGFANTPALLGSVELVEGDRRSAIGVVHAFVPNQGDAWTVAAAYLDRFVDEQRLLAASEYPGKSEGQAPYLRYMSQTGRRLAEMHVALASHKDIPDFAPEPTRPEDVQRWTDDIPGARRTRIRRAEASAGSG
jgi:maltose alpha-D-glucosyltransferase/alpha-amylase